MMHHVISRDLTSLLHVMMFCTCNVITFCKKVMTCHVTRTSRHVTSWPLVICHLTCNTLWRHVSYSRHEASGAWKVRRRSGARRSKFIVENPCDLWGIFFFGGTTLVPGTVSVSWRPACWRRSSTTGLEGTLIWAQDWSRGLGRPVTLGKYLVIHNVIQPRGHISNIIGHISWRHTCNLTFPVKAVQSHMTLKWPFNVITGHICWRHCIPWVGFPMSFMVSMCLTGTICLQKTIESCITLKWPFKVITGHNC